MAHAGLSFPHEAINNRGILCIDGKRQPVFRRVCQAHGLVAITGLHDGQHRAEHLLGCNLHPFRDICNDCWLHVVATGAIKRWDRMTSAHQPGPLSNCCLNRLLDLSKLVGGYDRPHVRGIAQAVADTNTRYALAERAREALVGRLLHNHAARAHTPLTRAGERREGRSPDRCIEVRVGHHNQSILAPQFHLQTHIPRCDSLTDSKPRCR